VYILGNLGSLNTVKLAEDIADVFLDKDIERSAPPFESKKAISIPESDLSMKASLYHEHKRGINRFWEMRDRIGA
jgi:hypothetical protein